MLDSTYCRFKGHQWKYTRPRVFDVRYHPWNKEVFKKVKSRRTCICCDKVEDLVYRREPPIKDINSWSTRYHLSILERWV